MHSLVRDLKYSPAWQSIYSGIFSITNHFDLPINPLYPNNFYPANDTKIYFACNVVNDTYDCQLHGYVTTLSSTVTTHPDTDVQLV